MVGKGFEMRSVIALIALAGVPATAREEAGAPRPPFFALCMDTHDAKKRNLQQQAAMLKELGYDGAGHLWLGGVAERLKTLDAHGLKLFQVYLRVNIAPGKQAYDPRLKEAVKLLKGRDVILGLLVSGMKPSDPAGDPRAVEIIREMADLAAPAGVRLALYPHTNDWLERLEDAVRVAKKVDRKSVGAMLNLCHWLKVDGDEKKLEPLLREAMAHLFVVTINGADSGAGRAAGWNRLIQPLDSGSFDNYNLLRTLQQLGYRGPIGLQCYGLRGDARQHLARSIKAWRKLSIQLAAKANKETAK